MNSKRKGSLAVGAAIGYFSKKGYPVLLPIADSEKYDLVVDEKGVLQKIQCKYTSDTEPSGAYIVHLRTFGGYRDKTYYLKYEEGDFDYLFILCENGNEYLIPAEKVLAKSLISVGKKSWNEYKC
jgi:hypothetical protein